MEHSKQNKHKWKPPKADISPEICHPKLIPFQLPFFREIEMLGGNVEPIQAYGLHTSSFISYSFTTATFLQLTGLIKQTYQKCDASELSIYIFFFNTLHIVLGIILYQFLSPQKTPSNFCVTFSSQLGLHCFFAEIRLYLGMGVAGALWLGNDGVKLRCA